MDKKKSKKLKGKVKDEKFFNSPLLSKYKKAFEKDETSRVFAPLAETYRKLGLVDQALQVLKIGIQNHPHYLLGILTLAACYDDLKKYQNVYDTLKPYVSDNRENIRLQKTYGRACIELGHMKEALETYKYLLFINPKDKDAAAKVEELESSAEMTALYTAEAKLTTEEASEDSWVAVELKPDEKVEETAEELFEEDEWSVSSGAVFDGENEEAIEHKELSEQNDQDEQDKLPEIVSSMTEAKVELEQADIEPIEDPNAIDVEAVDAPTEVVTSMTEAKIEIEKEAKNNVVNLAEKFRKQSDEPPLITHTLVDLYVNQKLYKKAKELLEKYLELNPNDERTQKRLMELQGLHQENDEGHTDLMRLYDEKINKSDKNGLLKNKYMSFLDKIKNKAANFHQVEP